MEFIEAPAFSRLHPEYLSTDSYRRLQLELVRTPDAGDVIPGTGGFRKLRWSDERRGKGRRGGLRVIYYYFPSEAQIWLLTLYGKNEAAGLTPAQQKALKLALANELQKRRSRRHGRK